MPAASSLRVLAIANQKGGVGKTTTAINLGTALAAVGEKVLILDLDPQGNASTGVGVADDARPVTSFDVLTGKATIARASMKTLVPNLSIVPANADLVGLESEMMAEANRPFRLRDAVAALIAEQRAKPAEVPYGYLLIDCPPSLNLLTLNAMVAAHAVLVPVQCEFFALEGISQLKADHRPDQGDAESGARDPGRRAHHARCPHVALEGSRERGAQLLRRQGLRDHDPRATSRWRRRRRTASRSCIYDYDCHGSQDYIRLAHEVIQRERQLRAA